MWVSEWREKISVHIFLILIQSRSSDRFNRGELMTVYLAPQEFSISSSNNVEKRMCGFESQERTSQRHKSLKNKEDV